MIYQHASIQFNPLGRDTYYVTLKTIDAKSITLYVVDGLPVLKHDFDWAVELRLKKTWGTPAMIVDRTWIKEDPRRPLGKAMQSVFQE